VAAKAARVTDLLRGTRRHNSPRSAAAVPDCRRGRASRARRNGAMSPQDPLRRAAPPPAGTGAGRLLDWLALLMLLAGSVVWPR